MPEPGNPFGVLAENRRVYVGTSRGFHLAEHRPAERLFTYNRHGKLLAERKVKCSHDDMCLYGLALDDQRRLYAADMNGRILRYRLRRGIPRGKPDIYASTPPEYMQLWQLSMWNGIAFDRDGDLFVADDKAAIWRVSPDGESHVWFRDPRLAGGIGGPFGTPAIGPDGKLYLATLGPSPAALMGSGVYRLPLVDDPSPADLESFHVFPARLDQPPPVATGIAFGRSGRAYVGLSGTHEIAVLSRDGRELRRIRGVTEPLSLSFRGKWLFVAGATNFFPPINDPNSWKIVKVWVGERGMPLAKPRVG